VESNAGMIDVALDGITVRIGPEAPAATIAAELRALRVGT
jgi:transposase